MSGRFTVEAALFSLLGFAACVLNS